jgi:hypothetical protein
MRNLQTYEDFLLEAELNEIGETVIPFSYKRVGIVKVGSWMADLASLDKSAVPSGNDWIKISTIEYTFQSDKAKYRVHIPAYYRKHDWIPAFRKPGAPKPHDYNILLGVAFDIEGGGKEEITNLNEHFRVISTVISIVEEVAKAVMEIKWIKLQEIYIAPAKEEFEKETPAQKTKRGILYAAYLRKQVKRLPGDWSVEMNKDAFIIKNGKMSSTDPNQFMKLDI